MGDKITLRIILFLFVLRELWRCCHTINPVPIIVLLDSHGKELTVSS